MQAEEFRRNIFVQDFDDDRKLSRCQTGIQKILLVEMHQLILRSKFAICFSKLSAQSGQNCDLKMDAFYRRKNWKKLLEIRTHFFGILFLRLPFNVKNFHNTTTTTNSLTLSNSASPYELLRALAHTQILSLSHTHTRVVL